MLLTKADEKRLEYAVIATVFLVLFALTWLTPMFADDYSYCFSWADNTRIQSLGQIPASMAVHRQLTNGRVLTHGLVQLLLLAPSKLLFDLLNACVAVAFLLVLLRPLPPLTSRRRALLLICASLLFWCLMPAFGQVFLWLDGAVNYGWGACLFLLYLLPYASAWLEGRAFRVPWMTVPFLILAFVVGTWSESGAPASFFIALSLFVLHSCCSRRIDAALLGGLVLELLGFVFLMRAPATLGRASSGFDLSSLGANLQTVLILCRTEILPLYALYAVSLAVAATFGADRRRLALSALYCLGGMVCLAAYCFAAYFTSRHFCLPVCFTVQAELLVLGELLRREKPLLPRMLASGLAAWFLFLFPLGVLDIGVTYKHSFEREATIRAALDAGEHEVSLEVYLPATPYSVPYHMEDLYPEAHVWPNGSLEAYYGLDAIYGVQPGDEEAPTP